MYLLAGEKVKFNPICDVAITYLYDYIIPTRIENYEYSEARFRQLFKPIVVEGGGERCIRETN